MRAQQIGNLLVELSNLLLEELQFWQRHLQQSAVDRAELSAGAQRFAQLCLRGSQPLISQSAQRHRVGFPDAKMMRLLSLILKSTGKKGVPQGGVISPVLSNLYLNEVDRMLEKARATTRRGKYTHVQYARFADDMVILIDSHPRNDWLMRAVDKRLREELAKLRVEINEEKSRIIDLAKGGSFAFLGFEYRLVLGRNRKWRPQFVPKLKKRTALFAKLREIFRQHVSQPVGKVIEMINSILRGWVNYFRIGHSGRCFSKIRDWVEKKIRRHLMRARLRKGQGWKRWSSEWIYRVLGLYNDYRLRRSILAKAAPVPDGV